MYGHILRYERTVHSQHILAFVVRTVRVAAAGDGMRLVQRRYKRNVKSVKGTFLDGLSPGILFVGSTEVCGGISKKVLFYTLSITTL